MQTLRAAPGRDSGADPEALERARFSLTLALLSAAVAALASAALPAAALASPPAPPDQLVVLAGVASLAFAVTVLAGRRILRRIAHLETARAELQRLREAGNAETPLDPLTGLGNHRSFQEELDRQIEALRRHGDATALILIDLDDFKLTNDSAGHAAGDALLLAVGALVKSSIRLGDRAFRIGGDEFAVILPRTTAEGAEIVARRVLAAALEPRPESLDRAVSFSAGISACPEFGTGRAQLLSQAAAALAWSKAHGRTTVTLFDPERHQPLDAARPTPDLAAAVAGVVTPGALKPVYQPIVDLATGRVVGYEGLIRPARESGFPHAGALFEAAQVAGKTTELDGACIDAIAAGASALRAELWLSINISPRSLEAPEFSATELVQRLAHYGFAPERIVLEVTERDAVEDEDRLRRNLMACRRAGIRLAADDVGAGSTGLQLLSLLSFDIIKVDLSLVQGGALRDSALGVLRMLAGHAGRSDAQVVAEGIESSAQLRVVRALGFSAGQGYLLGRPGESLDVADLDLDALTRQERWPPLPEAALGLVPAAGARRS